ncbi:MAG: bifunctional pyr operon transcriptional regulator/uracil phosphoribosyltransferase PyrR [Candidatus Sumerlaeia bacterium]|nr:bifunctional pyr operon transcriptional regulator/uracil phosphoribosyltransferase PyrR [Candidatus Sumerlaeia bacterium]
MEVRRLMTETELEQVIQELCRQITRQFDSSEDLAIVGIRTRGATLAHRLQRLLSNQYRTEIPLGTLDITLYRDDLSQLASQPLVQATDLPFDVSRKKIILVDDVLFTGRTVRAALDQLVDFGRPAVVRLLVIIDRGWREYPIQPDFVGKKIETALTENVQVRLREIDGEDGVYIVSRAD